MSINPLLAQHHDDDAFIDDAAPNVRVVESIEEAVQDAFAKAYPKWSRIENPDAYMRMAVVNVCRRVQRRRRLVRRTPTPRGDDASLGADHIADTLHMAIGTVKSTLHRARAR